MRLDPEQVQHFHKIIKKYFKKNPYALYLYGSRVHDHLKGGDIDLFIETDDQGVQLFNKFSLDILVEIKGNPHVGQRRIDLKAVTPEQIKSSAFLKHAQENAILL